MSNKTRTIIVTDEDAEIIVSALRNDAGRLRSNAPQPWYVGSARSRVHCEAMGAAVKRSRLADSIAEGGEG